MHEMMAKVINCHSHAMSSVSPSAPTITAATPNQTKCTPGTTDSRANNATATMNQFQAPRFQKNSDNPMAYISNAMPQHSNGRRVTAIATRAGHYPAAQAQVG